MTKLYAFTYTLNGKTYSIRIHGSEEEAITHADNLGLVDMGQVVAIVDYECEIVEGSLQ